MAAADRQLTSKDPLAHAHLHPCPDRVDVRCGLHDAERQPVAHGAWVRGVARPDVPPQPDRPAVVDLDEVEHAVDVEVGQRRSPPSFEGDDAGGIGCLAERPVRLPEEKVAGVQQRVVGLVGDVALRDEEIDEAVVVDVRELVVPGGGGPGVAAGERSRGVGPAP